MSGTGEPRDRSIVDDVAWALHAWSCPLCFTNGPTAMAESEQDHVTEADRSQAWFLVGALGLHRAPEGTDA